MNDEVKAKVRELITYLDSVMEETQSREVADLSNYLEEVLAK